jgi:hypothetical protein
VAIPNDPFNQFGDMGYPTPPMGLGAPPPPPQPQFGGFGMTGMPNKSIDGEPTPAPRAEGDATNAPVAYPKPGAGIGEQPPGGDSRCPMKNGIARHWDEERQRCTYTYGCPPGHGYVPSKTPGQPGKQGCQKCPPGTSVSEQGRCLPGLNGGDGGGDGGGGGMGGGTSALTPFGPGSQVTKFNDDLEKYIRDSLESPSRFTPEIMQSLYGQIASQSSGAISRGEEAVKAEAASRGMSRAGQTGAAIRDVRNAAEAQRGQSTIGVQIQKINTDYQDKMGSLDRAQKYLDSMRDSEYRYALLSEQRRQFDANLALGYANLAQNRTLLEMQLQSSWDMLRASFGYGMLGQGV